MRESLNPSDNSPEKKTYSVSLPPANIRYHDIKVVDDHWSEAGDTFSKLANDIINQQSIVITPRTGDLLLAMELVEFEIKQRPDWVVQGVPYFEHEREKHFRITNLNRNITKISEFIVKYGNIDASQDLRSWQTILKGIAKRFKEVVLQESAEVALIRAVEERDNLLAELRTHAVDQNSQTNFGAMRISSEALELFSTISLIPEEPKNLRALAWSTLLFGHCVMGLQTQDILKDSIRDLTLLNDPKHPRREMGGADYLARDLRKLYLGIVSGALPVSPAVLGKRNSLINVSHYIDLYLADPGSNTSKAAEGFLKARDGGSYCPNPYPSWKYDLKVRAHNEAQEIVNAGRSAGYSFSKLSQETKRLPNGEDPIFLRFGKYSCDDVKGVYASSSNHPPGRGWFFSGLDLSKLLFKADGSLHPDVEGFYYKNRDWVKKEINESDQAGLGFLRGAEIVTVPSDLPVIRNEHYTLVDFNDHFSETYDAAWLYPTDIIQSKIKKCLYQIDRAGQNKAQDLLDQGFTAQELTEECIRLGRAPLNLSWISTLFGGCGFSYPTGWSPHFEWERDQQYVAWKDVNGHVHLSWKIWNFRKERAKVDATLLDDQKLCHEVYEVARAYFSLLAIFKNRYAAWKCDQTPGEYSAPKMLVESYKWHHQTKGKPLEERPVLCYADRGQASTKFTPLIDTATMRLYTDSQVIQLPTWSDGTDNIELSHWRKHVLPLLTVAGETVSESNNELCLIGREYVTF